MIIKEVLGVSKRREGVYYNLNDDHDPNRVLETYGMVKDGHLTIRHSQDVTESLAYNRRLYNLNERPTGKEWHRIARIDPIIYHYILDKYKIDALKQEDHKALIDLLHTPEFLYCRTAPGDFRKRPERKFFRASTPTAGSPMSLIGKSR